MAKYSILNDADNDVFNLWDCVENKNGALIDALKRLVVHESLFYHWVKNKETDPIKKAVRFLFLSNFSYMGKQETFRLLHSSSIHKLKLIGFIEVAQACFKRTMFRCVDFRLFFKGICCGEDQIPKRKRLVYIDSPYLGTTEMYGTKKWSTNDRIDLVDLLKVEDYPFAMSEYRSKEIEKIAKDYNWQIIPISKGGKLNKKSEEILIVNYPIPEYKQGGLF